MGAPNDEMLCALAAEVAEDVLRAGGRLVTAESCTGGWIGKVCTDLPGRSRCYHGGAVV